AAGSYFYLVTAVLPTGESPASPEVTATAPGSGKVTLTWNAVAGATGYRVYRGTTSGGESVFFTVAGGGTTTFVDMGAAGSAGSLDCGASLACPRLPLLVGTESFQLPINDPIFSGAGKPGENVLGINVGIDGTKLFSDPADAFTFSVSPKPDWSNFKPDLSG